MAARRACPEPRDSCANFDPKSGQLLPGAMGDVSDNNYNTLLLGRDSTTLLRFV